MTKHLRKMTERNKGLFVSQFQWSLSVHTQSTALFAGIPGWCGRRESKTKTYVKGCGTSRGPLKLGSSVTYFILLCPLLVAICGYEVISEAVDR